MLRRIDIVLMQMEKVEMIEAARKELQKQADAVPKIAGKKRKASDGDAPFKKKSRDKRIKNTVSPKVQ